MSILLAFVLICFLCGNIYIYVRAMQTIARMPIIIKSIFSLLFWTAAFSLFIVLSLRHSNLPEYIPRIMFKIGSTWLVFILYMSVTSIIFDAIKHFIVPRIRNIFIYSLIITIIILITGYINYLYPDINRIDIAIDKPIKGDSIKVVAVSDLHLGYGTGKKRLKKFVEMINAENPDLILIAGDLIDNSLIPLYSENMAEELNNLHAPMGVYMAPGNHEYISGIEESRHYINNHTSIKLLPDSVVSLPNGIQLILRDDARNLTRTPIDSIMQRVDVTRAIIMVDHQPFNIAKKDSAGIDLQFSGHTHNGQIWPGNIATHILYEQSHGYRKWNHSHVYVSSGLSLWGPPFRIGTNCDMAVFNIYSTKR